MIWATWVGIVPTLGCHRSRPEEPLGRRESVQAPLVVTDGRDFTDRRGGADRFCGCGKPDGQGGRSALAGVLPVSEADAEQSAKNLNDLSSQGVFFRASNSPWNYRPLWSRWTVRRGLASYPDRSPLGLAHLRRKPQGQDLPDHRRQAPGRRIREDHVALTNRTAGRGGRSGAGNRDVSDRGARVRAPARPAPVRRR